MTEISQETRTVLERSADALESNWRKGGSAGFHPFMIQPSRELAATHKCLVDQIAYQTASYLYEDLPDADADTEGRISEEIFFTVFPVMQEVIREKIREIGFVTNNYTFELSNLGSRIDPEVFFAWYAQQSTLTTSLIMLYNDNICDGGEDAADIVRRTIKEL